MSQVSVLFSLGAKAPLRSRMTNIQIDQMYDFTGLRCPHLLIAVIKAVRECGEGEVLEVSADDLNAPSSITAWVNQSGCTLLDMYDDGHTFTFVLQPPSSL